MNILSTYYHPTIEPKPIGSDVLERKSTNESSQINWIKDEANELISDSQIDPFKELFSSKEFRTHVIAGRKQLKKDSSKLIDLTEL